MRVRRTDMQSSAKKKTAVIVTGNPLFVKGNPSAIRFYGEIEEYLKGIGYAVSRDPGDAYTSPPKADIWIGHSRGADRMRFAPKGTLTMTV
jgi:hypothetical protein